MVSCRSARLARLSVRLACLASACAVVSHVGAAHAWLLHEHVRIGHEAALWLAHDDPSAHAALQAAWDEARGGSDRFCAGLDVGDAPYPMSAADGRRCIPFSAWPALAADHSCKPRQLGESLVERDWILQVLAAGNDTADALSSSVVDPAERIDAWHDQHVQLQLSDAAYLSRARGNDAHHVLARIDGSFDAYLERALAPGAPANATAHYVAYHVTALSLALRARRDCESGAAGAACRSRLLWRALLTESSALHFLEDAFSAGHFVGTWGEDADRKGTHDHYCQFGVEAELWKRQTCATDVARCAASAEGCAAIGAQCRAEPFGDTSYHAFGDAFMSPADSEHAARAVAESLRQLAAMLSGAAGMDAADLALIARATPYESLDTCSSSEVMLGLRDFARARFVREVLELTPMPSPETPSLPRFRNEIGLFFLGSARIDGDLDFASRSAGMWDFNGSGRMRLGVGIGYAADDVLTRYSDSSFLAEGVLASLVEQDGSTTHGVGVHLRLPVGPLVLFDLLHSLVVGPDEVSAGARVIRGLYASTQGGTLWRFERVWLLGADSTIQFFLGREVTLLRYFKNRGEASSSTPVWEILLPFLSVHLERIATGRLTSNYGFELALTAGFSPTETRVGFTLTFGARLRRYL